MPTEIRLALIWHMHQPDYREPYTGDHILPWVRIHSLRGYTDIAAVSKTYPGFRQTVNFSPVLLSQIADLQADISKDYFFELSRKPADELSEFEQDFILRHFFFINWNVHVKSHPRYSQLLLKRGMEISGHDLEYVRGNFTMSDFRDLVVLFNLTWCGFTLRKDRTIRDLIRKERGYTEEDKLIIQEKHQEALNGVLKNHAAICSKGFIELICSPENHPILPLLIDSRVRADTDPATPEFHYPADARRQVKRGIEIFRRTFGHVPDGMWPSEGSVSQDAVELIQSEGFKWIATDEALLLNKSTGTMVPANADIWTPWLVGNPDGNPLYCCFRNRGLSDDIGFHYAKIEPAIAVREFIGNLENIAGSVKSKVPLLVTLVCDGENPWEYYPDSGEGFLSGIAEALEKHPFIKTTTPGEYISEFPSERRVEKLGAGSWINGDFGIWMGSPEAKKAWEILGHARLILDKVDPVPEGSADEIGSDSRRKALGHLWVAEGSDWFWWYGEPFSSPLDYIFDMLFRRRVKRAYELMGIEPPIDVQIPVDPKLPFDNINVEAPLDIIQPEIDGKITTFYEWSGAGHLKASLLEGLIATRKAGPVSDIYFSANATTLYVRLDVEMEVIKPEDVLLIRFLRPLEFNITLDMASNPCAEMRLYKPGRDIREHEIVTLPCAAVGKIVELAVPIDVIGAGPSSTICFSTLILRGIEQVDRCPLFGTLSVTVPDEKYLGSLWRV